MLRFAAHKAFQIHSYFDRPKDGLCREDLIPFYVGSNWGLERLFPWISHFWGQILIERVLGPASVSFVEGTMSSYSECCFPSLPLLTWIYSVVHTWTPGLNSLLISQVNAIFITSLLLLPLPQEIIQQINALFLTVQQINCFSCLVSCAALGSEVFYSNALEFA